MHLDQVRRQAKELRDAARRGEPHALRRIAAFSQGRDEQVSLALAQFVVAREHGFASWPRLKAAADIAGGGLAEFLDVSLHGPAEVARAMLREHPELAANPYAAAVLGDAGGAVDAASVLDDRGWPPLLYACYSRWHQFDPPRSAALTATVRRLLDAGANPGAHNGRLPNQGYQSALLGAVVTNKPDVVALLLSRGALVNDRVSLHTAAELRHHRCLQLLVERGATVERTWALGAAVFARDPWAVRLLLEAVAQAGGDVAARASEQLEDATREGSSAVIETLLAFGAEPAGRGELVREALRAGASEVAALLEPLAGMSAVTPVDRLIAACLRGDRAEAQRLAAEVGTTMAPLDRDDQTVLVHAAGRVSPASVELLLDCGWPVDARDDQGETALHNAAYQGKVDTVRLLLSRGAPVDARDDRFDATALAYATVGSRERRHDPDADGDWPATVQTLLEAGAARTGVWLRGEKAPAHDVAVTLARYGVQSEPPERTPAGPELPDSGAPGPRGTGLAASGGAVAEVAELLRIAFETTDLDLFAALLAPDVRWGGGPLGCHTREQVLAQYRSSVDLGFHGTLDAIEEHGEDRLIIEVRYTGQAEGMPAGPAGTRAQVLRIADDLIVSIDGYPDVATARQAVQTT